MSTLRDCECITVTYQDLSGIGIEYCPLHDAARDLLAVVKELIRLEEESYLRPDGADLIGLLDEAKQAVAKAEGRKS